MFLNDATRKKSFPWKKRGEREDLLIRARPGRGGEIFSAAGGKVRRPNRRGGVSWEKKRGGKNNFPKWRGAKKKKQGQHADGKPPRRGEKSAEASGNERKGGCPSKKF